MQILLYFYINVNVKLQFEDTRILHYIMDGLVNDCQRDDVRGDLCAEAILHTPTQTGWTGGAT